MGSVVAAAVLTDNNYNSSQPRGHQGRVDAARAAIVRAAGRGRRLQGHDGRGHRRSSQARLDWTAPTATAGGHARFHGTISTALPRDRQDIQRTGYAAWRTTDRPATVFGRGLWNMDPYVYLRCACGPTAAAT